LREEMEAFRAEEKLEKQAARLQKKQRKQGGEGEGEDDEGEGEGEGEPSRPPKRKR
jgi:hypothetical protein